MIIQYDTGLRKPLTETEIENTINDFFGTRKPAIFGVDFSPEGTLFIIYDDGKKTAAHTSIDARGRPKIPASLRWRVWERDNFTCRMCDRRQYLEIDHVIPVSRGGETTIENSQTLCRTCNRRKGASVEGKGGK